MRATKPVVVVSLFALAAVMTAGCAKPPQAELDAANAAFIDAQNAEAEQYAPVDYADAKTLIDKMDAQVQKKQYDLAKETAIEARQKAENAKEAAEDAKQARKRDAQAAVDSVQKDLETMKGLISTLETTPGFRTADLEPFKNQIPQFEAKVTEIENLNNAGKFNDAAEMGTATLGRLSKAEEDLNALSAKFDETKKAGAQKLLKRAPAKGSTRAR